MEGLCQQEFAMVRKYTILVLCLLLTTGTALAADSASLFKAVNSNNVKEVRALITASPDLVGSASDGGMTALHIAAARGYGDIALLLIEKGADVNARTIHDSTPLSFAVVNNHPDVSELLRENGGIQ
jgi:ankyrin repeat protein